MSVLIKNGRIITASEDYVADIIIEGEKITAIGKGLPQKADHIIDAQDKLIFPGGIDPHVHLDLPVMGIRSSDNFETGTRAAIFGGTTTIIDFANQQKGGTLYSALETWQKKATGNAYCDYSFHVSVTDFTKNTKAEMKSFIEQEGITSFKTFMAYKDTLMIDDATMKAVMEEVKKYGGMVTVHATDGNKIESLVEKFRVQNNLSPLYHYLSQPDYSESEATGRFIDMAIETGVNAYVVHMTCAKALEKIKLANQNNHRILAETCPQYLLLDADLYKKGDESVKWILSPPLRTKEDRESLWTGIQDGYIQTVGTDHCPFMMEDKLKNKEDFTSVPNGIPGIEHRMELLFSEGVLKERISLNKFVEVTSTNAAKIFGLYPQKGDIKVGSDADIVIFNPAEKHIISAKTHHHHCDYSAYEGWEVAGKVKSVLLRGEVVLQENEIQIEKGYGRFLKRAISDLGKA